MRYIIIAILLMFIIQAVHLGYSQSVSLPGTTITGSQILGCGLLPTSAATLISESAPWYCPINQQIYSVWIKYLPLGIIAVGIAISIAAIIFAVGIVLGNSKIRSFGLAELYEAFATGLIVGMFLYVCAIVFGFIPSIVTGPINPYATSIYLMRTTITKAESLYGSIFSTYLSGSAIASLGIGLGISGYNSLGNFLNSVIGLPISLYQLFFLTPSLQISKLLADGIIALYAEYYLVLFFAVASIPAFIIPGVLLRAFLPTRGLGGMLMAIGIAFYLVVPIMFSVAYYFTAPSLNSQFATATAQMNLFSANNGFITNGLSKNSELATEVKDITSAIAPFWLLVFFYPSLIMAVSYVFIVQMAAIIGGVSGSTGRLRSFI